VERPEVVKQNTKIVCPACHSIIGEFTKDAQWGSILSEKNILIYGMKIEKGTEMLCPKCRFPYGVDISMMSTEFAIIHTENGWMLNPFPELLTDEFITNQVKMFVKGKEQSNYKSY